MQSRTLPISSSLFSSAPLPAYSISSYLPPFASTRHSTIQVCRQIGVNSGRIPKRSKRVGQGRGDGRVEGAYVVVVHSTDMICLNTSIHLPDPLSFISPDSSVIRATCGSPTQAQAEATTPLPSTAHPVMGQVRIRWKFYLACKNH